MSADHIHSPTPEEIMEYLDGEGTAASRSTIAAHLETCGTCRTVSENLRGVSAHTQAWTVTPAPASLRVPPAARANVLRFRGWRPSRLLAAGLTAAAALLIVVSFTARGTRLAVSKSSVGAATGQSTAAVDAIHSQKDQAGRRLGPPSAAPAPVHEMTFSLGAAAQTALRTPAVIRTARLHIVAKDFTTVGTTVEGIVSGAAGFIDQMTVTGDTSAARTLRGTLRVPADRMADVLARLRQMGQVVEDTQGSQDVTDQIVDLDARLASARATELRLTQLLRDRTGRLSDVLEVERELTRVRLDIERLVAEQANIDRRVSYTTIDVTITEERKAGLDGPLSLATRIRVAAADGLESAFESIAWALLFILRAGPTTVLWGLAAVSVWGIARRVSQ